MKTCEYPRCTRRAYFLMSWDNEDGKHTGLVCTAHDRELGRTNLTKYMSLEEAILFERYLKETVDLAAYLDFPEWLTQMGRVYKPFTPIALKKSTEQHPVTLLTLSPRTHNALRRDGIITVEDLAGMSDYELSRIRMLGVKCIREIREALKEFRRG